jgi:hypothetical protein
MDYEAIDKDMSSYICGMTHVGPRAFASINARAGGWGIHDTMTLWLDVSDYKELKPVSCKVSHDTMTLSTKCHLR